MQTLLYFCFIKYHNIKRTWSVSAEITESLLSTDRLRLSALIAACFSSSFNYAKRRLDFIHYYIGAFLTSLMRSSARLARSFMSESPLWTEERVSLSRSTSATSPLRSALSRSISSDVSVDLFGSLFPSGKVDFPI